MCSLLWVCQYFFIVWFDLGKSIRRLYALPLPLWIVLSNSIQCSCCCFLPGVRCRLSVVVPLHPVGSYLRVISVYDSGDMIPTFYPGLGGSIGCLISYHWDVGLGIGIWSEVLMTSLFTVDIPRKIWFSFDIWWYDWTRFCFGSVVDPLVHVPRVVRFVFVLPVWWNDDQMKFWPWVILDVSHPFFIFVSLRT